MLDRKKLAQIIFDGQDAQSLLSDDIYDIQPELVECDYGFDDYDQSIEIYKVDNDVRLTEETYNLLISYGFQIIYVNHIDLWETHYFAGKFKPIRSNNRVPK